MKIAEVINDREVAVTGLGVAELKIGDVLIVKSEPHELLDPDTREVVGRLVRNKAVVKVFDVQTGFALARTYRQTRENVGGSSSFGMSAFADLMRPPKFETRTETLRRSPHSGAPLNEVDAVVVVGDLVEVFTGDVKDIPSSGVWR